MDRSQLCESRKIMTTSKLELIFKNCD